MLLCANKHKSLKPMEGLTPEFISDPIAYCRMRLGRSTCFSERYNGIVDYLDSYQQDYEKRHRQVSGR
jgi:hypothetical protein